MLLATHLSKEHEVVEIGPSETDGPADYPMVTDEAVRMVHSGEYDRGILICGTGAGMCMAANRHEGIRAFVGFNEEYVRLCRAHNHANVVCFGARTQVWKDVLWLTDVFLETEGDFDKRHIDRVEQLR